MQQNCFLIALSSITYANKAKILLRDRGIQSKISHTTKGINGCGYSLRIEDTPSSKAVQILSKAGIPVQNVKRCDAV